jgi:hypothetical protein
MLQNFARICSCSILLLSGVAFVGCDDSDDVVLPNGEVVNFADLDTNGTSTATASSAPANGVCSTPSPASIPTATAISTRPNTPRRSGC